ncbi:hypothetical protein ACRRTK_024924 [Alexandromys fortis]
MVMPALGGSCACAKMVEERVRVVRCGGSRLNFRRAVFSADSKYAGSRGQTGPTGRRGPGRGLEAECELGLRVSGPGDPGAAWPGCCMGEPGLPGPCLPGDRGAGARPLMIPPTPPPRPGEKHFYCQPLFRNFTYIFCVSGDFIKVYSSTTEECVHVLHGHKNLVSGILLNPNNHLQLYSCSFDGTIKLWDYLDGILIKTFTVGPKLHALYIPPNAEDSVFLTILKEDPDVFQLVSVKLPKSSSQNVEARERTFVLDYVNRSPKCIDFGNEGEYIAAVRDFYLSVYFLKKKKTCKRNFHDEKQYTYTCLHWHHDLVMDLAFTVSEITVIQRNLDACAVIQGLVKDRSISTGLMVDPKTKALVLNGKPGHLQFYSLQGDKQLYNLDIIQQEYINDDGLIQIELKKAAFSHSGTWLATVEQRQENPSELEMQMKLWVFSKKTQGFSLNTKIAMPHDDHITALCFNNAENYERPMLVTASRDGHFKVWVLADDSDIYKKAIGWTCDFVGSYHKYQATNCCFSEDSSLLAVSFEEIVTVWDTETWELKCTFCQRAGKIRHLCFGRLTCSKYLLGTTENAILCCWNLLSCSLQWSAKLNVSVLEADPYSDHVAAVSQSAAGSDLFVFKPSEPRPLYVQRTISREEVQWGVFVPRDVPESFTLEAHQWLNRSQFYFLTQSQSHLQLSGIEMMAFSLLSVQLLAEESLPTTPFSLLLGKHRRQQDARSRETSENELVQLPVTENIPAIKELLHTPAHILPSASFLCSLFVSSLLLSKETESAEEVPDVDMEENKESDDSDEENDLTEKAQETHNTDLRDDVIHQLSKREEKELRKFRKVDYSWLAAL